MLTNVHSFGELGYHAISRTVTDLFPEATIDAALHAPLDWDAFMAQVLIPEAIVLLIVEELQIMPDEAIETLEASTPFGHAYHSDSLDRTHCINHISMSNPAQFPLPSPLLTPTRLLSPNPGMESDQLPAPIDPCTLCNYCNELLPATSSAELVAKGEKLFSISWADPLPDNPGHRRTPHIMNTLDYCQRHRFERDHLPKALLEIGLFSLIFQSSFDVHWTSGRLCALCARTQCTAHSFEHLRSITVQARLVV
jgi:hypothetical protein